MDLQALYSSSSSSLRGHSQQQRSQQPQQQPRHQQQQGEVQPAGLPASSSIFDSHPSVGGARPAGPGQLRGGALGREQAEGLGVSSPSFLREAEGEEGEDFFPGSSSWSKKEASQQQYSYIDSLTSTQQHHWPPTSSFQSSVSSQQQPHQQAPASEGEEGRKGLNPGLGFGFSSSDLSQQNHHFGPPVHGTAFDRIIGPGLQSSGMSSSSSASSATPGGAGGPQGFSASRFGLSGGPPASSSSSSLSSSALGGSASGPSLAHLQNLQVHSPRGLFPAGSSGAGQGGLGGQQGDFHTAMLSPASAAHSAQFSASSASDRAASPAFSGHGGHHAGTDATSTTSRSLTSPPPGAIGSFSGGQQGQYEQQQQQHHPGQGQGQGQGSQQRPKSTVEDGLYAYANSHLQHHHSQFSSGIGRTSSSATHSAHTGSPPPPSSSSSGASAALPASTGPLDVYDGPSHLHHLQQQQRGVRDRFVAGDFGPAGGFPASSHPGLQQGQLQQQQQQSLWRQSLDARSTASGGTGGTLSGSPVSVNLGNNSTGSAGKSVLNNNSGAGFLNTSVGGDNNPPLHSPSMLSSASWQQQGNQATSPIGGSDGAREDLLHQQLHQHFQQQQQQHQNPSQAALLAAAAAAAAGQSSASSLLHPSSAAAAVAAAAGAGNSNEFSIFVGDLAPNLREEDLVAQFLRPPLWPPAHPLAIAHAQAQQARGIFTPSKVGPAPFTSTKSAKIMTDPVTGVSRGFGFVRFSTEADSLRALVEMQGVYIAPLDGQSSGRPLRVCPATPKNKTQQQAQTPSNGATSPAAAAAAAALGLGAGGVSPGGFDPHELLAKAYQGQGLGATNGAGTPGSLARTPGARPDGFPGTPPVGGPAASHQGISGLPQALQILQAQAARGREGPAGAAAAVAAASALGSAAAGGNNAGLPRDAFGSLATSVSPASAAALTSSALDPNNTTVFVGGLSSLISEDTLRTFFVPFGDIAYVKIPPGKGCGFVQFVRKIDAERAIERMQGFPIGGGRIRLSWGRSQGDKAAAAAAQAAQQATQLGHLASLAGLGGLSPSQLAQLAGLSSALSAVQQHSGSNTGLPASLGRPADLEANSALLQQLAAASAGLPLPSPGGNHLLAQQSSRLPESLDPREADLLKSMYAGLQQQQQQQQQQGHSSQQPSPLSPLQQQGPGYSSLHHQHFLQQQQQQQQPHPLHQLQQPSHSQQQLSLHDRTADLASSLAKMDLRGSTRSAAADEHLGHHTYYQSSNTTDYPRHVDQSSGGLGQHAWHHGRLPTGLTDEEEVPHSNTTALSYHQHHYQHEQEQNQNQQYHSHQQPHQQHQQPQQHPTQQSGGGHRSSPHSMLKASTFAPFSPAESPVVAEASLAPESSTSPPE